MKDINKKGFSLIILVVVAGVIIVAITGSFWFLCKLGRWKGNEHATSI